MADEKSQLEKTAENPDLLSLFTLTRCLDGIFWSLLTFYVILISTFRDLIFSSFPFLVCLPLFVICLVSFKIPGDFLSVPEWRKNIQMMKVFSLVAAFNFPFIIFLVRGSSSSHFSICSIVAIYSTMRVLNGVVLTTKSLGGYYQEESLVKESRMASIFLYLSISVAIAYLYMVTARPAFLANVLNNQSVGVIIKVSMLIVIIFPLLLPVTLLFRIKTIISIKTKNKLRKF